MLVDMSGSNGKYSASIGPFKEGEVLEMLLQLENIK